MKSLGLLLKAYTGNGWNYAPSVKKAMTMTAAEKVLVTRAMYWASIAAVMVVLLTTGIVGGAPVIMMP